MSYLKTIVLELHNCLHEFEPEDEIPMVWSREFQQRLAQNATHWADDQRRASHVSDMDFQDEEDAGIEIPYEDDDGVDPAIALGATLDFDYEQEEERTFKTKWGSAYRKWLNGDDFEEEEITTSLPKKGTSTEHADDCPDCFGTGMDFPRLKGDCKTCKGTCKVSTEEEEEGDDLNFTDDPDKVARAKKIRDKARAARDKAHEQRDKAKEKNAGEDFGGEDELGDIEDEGGVEGEGSDEWEDDDKQGVIRTIPNAHLVYKRQQEDGTFDELWHYNIGDDFKKELKIRRAILAGTDIPINKMKSPDGSQTYELWTVGNGQMLKIQGLPN